MKVKSSADYCWPAIARVSYTSRGHRVRPVVRRPALPSPRVSRAQGEGTGLGISALAPGLEGVFGKGPRVRVKGEVLESEAKRTS